MSVYTHCQNIAQVAALLETTCSYGRLVFLYGFGVKEEDEAWVIQTALYRVFSMAPSFAVQDSQNALRFNCTERQLDGTVVGGAWTGLSIARI
jgi:hypothetical protein